MATLPLPRTPAPSSKGSPGSGAFDLVMGAATRVDGPLNGGFQPFLIVVGERHEAEWLQPPGERAQHFCRTQHHPGPCQKHQFGITPSVDRMGHRKQATGQGNDFQFARDTAAVIEAKDRWSALRKIHSRGPLGGLRLGERHHVASSIYVPGPHEQITEGLSAVGYVLSTSSPSTSYPPPQPGTSRTTPANGSRTPRASMPSLCLETPRRMTWFDRTLWSSL